VNIESAKMSEWLNQKVQRNNYNDAAESDKTT
jgi:hypothetical protein